MAMTQNAICIATKVHASGRAVTASLLNNSMPMEHAIQEPTPITASERVMTATTVCLVDFA
eukprot:CAMPEP_0172741448 /NCGR_PEP_ID=MMETSP1074-20121228/127245_1 /TAXON_ID=2916 /ORGANISM="Ceratium fusus, Strain PA161109" /LENGTH=60 /DNA_ID=CAMNT_0013571761 /DNA_START=77 /DNA_END=256 /DNA_ORIENTATION=+